MIDPADPGGLARLEDLEEPERAGLLSKLRDQFTVEAAQSLSLEGLFSEERGVLPPPDILPRNHR